MTEAQQQPLIEALRDVGKQLKRHKVDFALIGGMAISIRVEPRFTKDVDLAVLVPNDKAAERIVGDLKAAGYREDSLLEQDATNRLATARLLAPGSNPRKVDLLFASSGIEPEIVQKADVIEVAPGLRVPVVCRGHLIALKTLSNRPGRPQDALDLTNLLMIAGPGDLVTARAACRLITGRGYSRDRNLLGLLDAALEKAHMAKADRALDDMTR